jgi:hypothetical protein
MSFQHLEWLFPAVVALHNAEEALWLPGWSKQGGRWRRPVASGVFFFAVTILTILIFILTGLSLRTGRETAWTYLVFGAMAVTLANVLVPHVTVSVATRSYMPGLATGLALNLPVLSVLLLLALRQGYVTGGKAALYSAGVAGLTLLLIPALFKAGKVLNL